MNYELMKHALHDNAVERKEKINMQTSSPPHRIGAGEGKWSRREAEREEERDRMGSVRGV
jgi:hypothetical protein